MSVPIFTIPETAFNPNSYIPAALVRRSRLLKFMLRLTRTSAGAVIMAYLVGIFGVRPLMEATVAQRSEFINTCLMKLRDLYINLTGKVEYIPTIGIERVHGTIKKVYADSVCQTEDLEKRQLIENPKDTLGQNHLLEKLNILLDRLIQCSGYSIQEFKQYKVVDFALKDLQKKINEVYFDQTSLFKFPSETRKPKVLSKEVKMSIREIKGMFMSGRT